MKKRQIFSFAASVLFGISILSGAENLVPAELRDFENATQIDKVKYWWGAADQYRKLTTADSYRGRSCLEVKADYPSNKLGVYIPLLKDIKAGNTYTATAYVKCSQKEWINIYIYTTKDGKTQEAVFKGYRVDRSWQQIKVTATLKKDAETLGIIIRTPGKDVNFFIDCIGLYEGENAPGEIPGRIIKKALSQIKPLVIPMTNKPPVFNGTGNDPIWNNALLVNHFFLTDGSGKTPSYGTDVRILHDEKNIYFQFRCKEKNPTLLKSRSLPGKPDWSDERIELHFNVCGLPDTDKKMYFSVNPAGISTTSNLDFNNIASNCSSFSGKDFWGIEFTLPANAVGKKKLSGEQWLLSIGRFRNTKTRETSCLAPIKGHFGQDIQAFRPFVFSPNSILPECYCISQGAMSVHENDSGNNQIIFSLDKPMPTELEVISLVNGKTEAKTLQEGQVGKHVSYYYAVKGYPGEYLRFILRSNGRILFQTENSLDKIAPSYRTYRLHDPLYNELLTDKKVTQRIIGSWNMPISADNFDKAMKYGKAYSFEKRFQELADANIHLEELMGSPYLQLPSTLKKNYFRPKDSPYMSELLEAATQNKVPKPLMYGYYHCAGQSSDGKITSVTRDANGYFGWLPDPLTQKVYLNGTQELLKQHGQAIGGLWLGDELAQLNIKYGLQMNTQHNLKNPSGFIQKAEKEVRENYGFGKFGIPWNNLPQDKFTPYRRRAYITWMHDKIRDVGKRFYHIVKQYDSNMPVRSYSNSGDPILNGFEFAGEFSDILLVQLGEGGGTISPVCQNYAYWVKLSKDISGVNAVMAYPHECDSGYPTGAASEDEMLELYSQIFRGGGESFSFWPASYGGLYRPQVYAVSCAEGYPLAWQYMLAISKHIAEMPKLRFPQKTETAILLSAESIKCEPGKNTADGLFTMLGPYSRAWFKFISDTTVELGRDRLNNYKIIYMPYAQYVKKDFPSKIADFLKNGGTVVSGDPLIFSNSIDAESLAFKRAEIFGIEILETGKKYTSVKFEKQNFPLLSDSVKIRAIGKNVKTIATFPDGSPAVVEHRYGKGKTIYFAFRPFSLTHLSPQLPWLADFKQRHEKLGGTTGHDIWRFQFPKMQISRSNAPLGKCLTNNYAFWNRFRLNDGILYNLDTQGSIAITRNQKTIVSPFTTSKLTDRRSCFIRTEEYKKNGYANWVEDFSGEKMTDITLDFKQEYPIDRLVLFWHGNLPDEMKIATATVSGQWKPVNFAMQQKHSGKQEIVCTSISIGKTTRYLQISFSKKANTKFIIAELEAWSQS